MMKYPEISVRQRHLWMEEILAAPLTELSLAEKAVALRIALHYNVETQCCHPSLDGIAVRTSLALRTVKSAKSKLVSTGRLAVAAEAGGRGNCNDYRLLMTQVPEAATERVQSDTQTVRPDAPFNLETVQGEARNGANRDNKRCTPVHPNKKKNKKEQEKYIQSAFEEWWPLYPRKVARGAAERAFERVIASGAASLEELKAGACRYAAEKAGKDVDFIKHPATWLNTKCWADGQSATGPAAESDDSLLTRQDAIVKAWSRSPAYSRTWHPEWNDICGGPPDSPQCKVPEEMLLKHGLRKVDVAA